MKRNVIIDWKITSEDMDLRAVRLRRYGLCV